MGAAFTAAPSAAAPYKLSPALFGLFLQIGLIRVVTIWVSILNMWPFSQQNRDGSRCLLVTSVSGLAVVGVKNTERIRQHEPLWRWHGKTVTVPQHDRRGQVGQPEWERGAPRPGALIWEWRDQETKHRRLLATQVRGWGRTACWEDSGRQGELAGAGPSVQMEAEQRRACCTVRRTVEGLWARDSYRWAC